MARLVVQSKVLLAIPCPAWTKHGRECLVQTPVMGLLILLPAAICSKYIRKHTSQSACSAWVIDLSNIRSLAGQCTLGLTYFRKANSTFCIEIYVRSSD